VITALALASPGPAAAATTRHLRHHRQTTNPVALAVALGESYWGAVPCNGVLRVAASANLPSESEAGPVPPGVFVLAWTTFAARDVTAPSTYTDCQIFLNATIWPNWQTEDSNFQQFCDVMTHELGHLFGHLDDGQVDPTSIEYPMVGPGTPNYNSVPECRHVVLWFGWQSIVGR
jgi:hypothetical protein